MKINRFGIDAIEAFLKRHHKNGPDFDYPLLLWIDIAENRAAEGKLAVIKISSHLSNNGKCHMLQLSRSCFLEAEKNDEQPCK